MASGLKPMDVDGREEAETQLYLKGPLSVLTSSVKTNSMVRSASRDKRLALLYANRACHSLRCAHPTNANSARKTAWLTHTRKECQDRTCACYLAQSRGGERRCVWGRADLNHAICSSINLHVNATS